jgi:hypothetical protein
LSDPAVVSQVVAQVPVGSLRDGPLRAILQTCYDLHSEGQAPSLDRVVLRLEDDPAVKALTLNLNGSIEVAPLPEGTRPAPIADRLPGVLTRLADRARQDRLRELESALKETDQATSPELYRSFHHEYLRLLNFRPATKPKTAS